VYILNDYYNVASFEALRNEDKALAEVLRNAVKAKRKGEEDPFQMYIASVNLNVMGIKGEDESEYDFKVKNAVDIEGKPAKLQDVLNDVDSDSKETSAL